MLELEITIPSTISSTLPALRFFTVGIALKPQTDINERCRERSEKITFSIRHHNVYMDSLAGGKSGIYNSMNLRTYSALAVVMALGYNQAVAQAIDIPSIVEQPRKNAEINQPVPPLEQKEPSKRPPSCRWSKRLKVQERYVHPEKAQY